VAPPTADRVGEVVGLIGDAEVRHTDACGGVACVPGHTSSGHLKEPAGEAHGLGLGALAKRPAWGHGVARR
jgi:hypothetical protein